MIPVGAGTALFFLGVVVGVVVMATMRRGGDMSDVEEGVAFRVQLQRRIATLEGTLNSVVADRDRMAGKLTAIGDLLNGGPRP